MSDICLKDVMEFERMLRGEQPSYSYDDSSIYLKYSIDKNVLEVFPNNIRWIYKNVPELSTYVYVDDIKVLEVLYNKYIPIYNMNTKENMFTFEQFQGLRKKMGGLKSLGADDLEISDNLYFPELDRYLPWIDANFQNSEMYRKPVVEYFTKLMSELGLSVSIGMNSGGDIELVEAGSTSRGTNVPEKIPDFDFTVRINPEKVWEVKNKLESIQCENHITRTSAYKVRLQGASIPGLNQGIDLDFSLTPQKKKYLSTEDALQERLLNIRMQDEEKYRLVIANIMFAKDYLKKMGTYKPGRSILGTREDRMKGGIGGVGIENLILQNGGSFYDACQEIAEKSSGKKFVEFEKDYELFDFGKNHVEVSKDGFPFDNFIMKNMRPEGYDNLVLAVNQFVNEYQNDKGHSL